MGSAGSKEEILLLEETSINMNGTSSQRQCQGLVPIRDPFEEILKNLIASEIVTIEQLMIHKENLEIYHRNCNIARTSGTAVGAIGYGMILGGIIMAPATGGIVLGLTIAGYASSVAAGLTNGGVNIVKNILMKKQENMITELLGKRKENFKQYKVKKMQMNQSMLLASTEGFSNYNWESRDSNYWDNLFKALRIIFAFNPLNVLHLARDWIIPPQIVKELEWLIQILELELNGLEEDLKVVQKYLVNLNEEDDLKEEISILLKEAKNIYKRALESNIDEERQILLEEAALIYKAQIDKIPKNLLHLLFYNIGMSYFRMAEIVQSSEDSISELTLVGNYLKEAIKYFGKALMMHRNIDTSWALKVLKKIEDMIELGLGRADLYVDKKPPSELYSYVDVVLKVSEPDDFVGNFIRTKCSLTQSRYFYKKSCDKLNSGNFEGSLQYLEYSRERIQLALQNAEYLESDKINSEIRVMEIEWKTQECLATSVQLMTQADRFLEGMQNQTRSKEYKLFTIVDMYKDALLLIRGIDMKKECILLARIGNLFQNDLKMSWKAKEYYEKALQLGQNFTQEELNSFQWYLKAKEFLETKKTKNESDIGPIIAKFKRQLDKIKTISDKCNPNSSMECKIKTTQKMLIHVYTHHPPRSSFQFKRDELTDQNTQKFLKKAIIYYHPSRGGRDNSDQEWNILSEEIAKYLTALHEYFKNI